MKQKLERYEEAIADYTKLIKLNSEDKEAYYLRGSVKQELKRNQEAIEDFDKAIELTPNYAKVYGR